MRRTGYITPVNLSALVEKTLVAVMVDELLERRDVAELPEEVDDFLAALEASARLAKLPDTTCPFKLKVRGVEVPMPIAWHGDVEGVECVVLSGAMPDQGRDEPPTTIFCPLLLVDKTWQPAGMLSGKMGCVLAPTQGGMPDAAALVAEIRRPTQYRTRSRGDHPTQEEEPT